MISLDGSGGNQDRSLSADALLPIADLSLTKAVSNATPTVGTNVTFTVNVTNTGYADTQGVTVQDILPSGYALVSASATLGSFASGTWTVGTLNVGTTATLTVTATVLATGNYTNVARVMTSSLPDPDSTPGNNLPEDDYATVVVTPRAPTDVKLVEFTAQASRAKRRTGVTLNWRTGFETDNLGFNVYREENGERLKVNPSLIAGSALQVGEAVPLTAGAAYAWTDARGPIGATYWLEEVDLNGQTTWHGPVFVGGQTDEDIPLITAQNSWLLSQLSEIAEPSRAETGSNATPFFAPPPNFTHALTTSAKPWTLPAQRAVKLSVRQAGWYRVTAAELAATGFDVTVNPQMLQLFADNEPVPLKINRDGAALASVEFSGVGLDLPATDTRTYWLTVGTADGARLEVLPARQNQSVSQTSFMAGLERKERTIYFSSLLNGEAENWFGAVVTPAGTVQPLVTRFIELAANSTAQLEIALQGINAQTHAVRVEINGYVVGTLSYAHKDAKTESFSFPAQWLREGENAVRLVSTAGGSDYSLVNCLRLRYARAYRAENDALSFTLGQDQTAQVSGFTTNDLRVLEWDAQGAMRELSVKTQKVMNNGVASYGFTLTGTGKNYLALANSRFARVAALTLNQPSNWRQFNQPADFLIFTHAAFKASADRLAAARRAQGWLPVVVDVEDAYDEFAAGAYTPQALKDLLAHAQQNWPRPLRSVLLFGAGHYDPRHYVAAAAADFVPIKLGDAGLLETATENWFTDFNNDGLADIPLGRLPVRTAAEAETIVTKLLNLKSEPTARGALLVSDRVVDHFDFQALNQTLAGGLPDTMAKRFIHRDEGSAAEIRQRITEHLNQTQPLIVNWSGHGSTDRWTGDGLLRFSDAAALNNRTPALFVMASCLNGYFLNATPLSMGEALLLNPQGGAFGVVASTGMNTPQPQGAFVAQLYRGLFSQGLTLGEAFEQARAAAGNRDARNTFVLLGDPTLRLGPTGVK